MDEGSATKESTGSKKNSTVQEIRKTPWPEEYSEPIRTSNARPLESSSSTIWSVDAPLLEALAEASGLALAETPPLLPEVLRWPRLLASLVLKSETCEKCCFMSVPSYAVNATTSAIYIFDLISQTRGLLHTSDHNRACTVLQKISPLPQWPVSSAQPWLWGAWTSGSCRGRLAGAERRPPA